MTNTAEDVIVKLGYQRAEAKGLIRRLADAGFKIMARKPNLSPKEKELYGDMWEAMWDAAP